MTGPTCRIVTDFRLAQKLLTSSQCVPPDLHSYIVKLQSESGKDFSLLIDVSRYLIPFMIGPSHKQTRRFLMPLLSPSTLLLFEDVIDRVIDEVLKQLEVKKHQVDAVEDIESPLYTSLIKRMFSLNVTSDFQSSVSTAMQIVEPLQSLKSLELIQSAYETLLTQCKTALKGNHGNSYIAFICGRYEKLEDKNRINLPMVLVSLIVASKTVAETMTNVIVDNQDQTVGSNKTFANPMWVNEHIDEIIHRSTSTNYIARKSLRTIRDGSLVVDEGELCMIHIPSVNTQDDLITPTQHTLSFGGGVRRCPGDHLAKMVLVKFIPRLFNEYPKMEVVKERTVRQRTTLVRRYSLVPLKGVVDQ